MLRNGRIFLILAGSMSSLIAFLHGAIILIGEPAYRFFPGLGDALADMLIAGSIVPTVIVVVITGFFLVYALYAFSGARILPALPLLRLGLCTITAIYVLRGLSNIPYYLNIFLGGKKLEPGNAVLYDSISLGIGLLYWIGTRMEWESLKTKT